MTSVDGHKPKITQIYIFELLQTLKLAPNPIYRSILKARKGRHSNGYANRRKKQKRSEGSSQCSMSC